MIAAELLKKLQEVVATGHGNCEVLVMVVENGVTHGDAITDCFAAAPYDGPVVWMLTK